MNRLRAYRARIRARWAAAGRALQHAYPYNQLSPGVTTMRLFVIPCADVPTRYDVHLQTRVAGGWFDFSAAASVAAEDVPAAVAECWALRPGGDQPPADAIRDMIDVLSRTAEALRAPDVSRETAPPSGFHRYTGTGCDCGRPTCQRWRADCPGEHATAEQLEAWSQRVGEDIAAAVSRETSLWDRHPYQPGETRVCQFCGRLEEAPAHGSDPVSRETGADHG